MSFIKIFLVALALLAALYSTQAQNPIITSFSQNGVLVCSNLNAGSVAAVEWASSLAGPWYADWTSLGAITVGTNQQIEVSVPMFYRVHGLTGTNSTPAGMVFIPAGSFTIGDTVDAARIAAPTNVYVSAFYMDASPVTSNLWATVYAYATNQGYLFDNTVLAKAADHPMTSMSWYDSVTWCNARSRQAGEQKCCSRPPTVATSALEHAVSTASLGPRRSSSREIRLASTACDRPVAVCACR